MIDIHCHILPGLDDGARSLEEAIGIARVASAQGVTAIVATPHVRDDYPTQAAAMEARVTELNAALAHQEVAIEVLPGGELSLDRAMAMSDEELRHFRLGGRADVILLEAPLFGWRLDIPSFVVDLRARGIVPILAHPERNIDVAENPSRLRPIVEAGAYVQLTAASVDGTFGPAAQEAANRLIDLELAHVIASDAHHAEIRTFGLRTVYEVVRDERLARWLTMEMPGALIAGAEPPSRPSSGVTGRRWWRMTRG